MNKWLSKEAAEAKKLRRQSERRWKRTGDESDRTIYRSRCKVANRLITESVASHNKDRLEQSRNNPRKHWSVINDLLHSKAPVRKNSVEENDTIAHGLAKFFKDKISILKDKIRSKFNQNDHDPLAFDQPFHTQPMDASQSRGGFEDALLLAAQIIANGLRANIAC